MTPYCMILDDFFGDFEKIREYLAVQPFVNEREPAVEGEKPLQVYDFKDDTLNIAGLLQRVFGSRIMLRSMMARLAVRDTDVAYGVHSDADMKTQFNMVVYLTKQSHIRPESGVVFCRLGDTGEEVYDGDKNNFKHGIDDVITELDIPMRENRAVIFPSNLLHYAKPMHGGFGTSFEDGRLVLSVFFSLDNMLS